MTSPPSYRIEAVETVETNALCALYNSVGWSTYTNNPDQLVAAIRGSSFVVIATDETGLVGLARAVSDDTTIAYVQDILVRPTHQGQGMGRALLQAILDRYAHVRQKVLLTDDRPGQLGFYASMGFSNTRELEKTPLNAFVRIEGAELS